MKKVVIFNAPPNAGKDVSVANCVEVLNTLGTKAQHKEFKENLFKATKAAFGISDEVWNELYTRENKELPSYYLIHDGRPISPREAMINTSEKVLKPLFGLDVMGQMAANSLEEGVNIFSDGGFHEELTPIVDLVGADNVLVIQIHRDGCSFDNDSRDYVFYEGVSTIRVNNEGTLEELFDTTSKLVFEWLEGINI